MPRRNVRGGLGSAPVPPDPPDPDTLLAQVRHLLAEAQALSSRIAAINEVAVAMNNSRSLDTILPVVADQAKWILDFDYCALALVSPGEPSYRLAHLFGPPLLPPDTRYPVAEGAVGRVLSSAQADLITDPGTTATPAFGDQARAAGLQSGLVTPLVAGGTVLGAFVLLSQTAGHYSLDDLRIAYLLALQLAGALQTLQTLDREQQRSRQFQALAQVGHETTGLGDPAGTFLRVVEIVREAFGYLRVNLATIEGDQLVFTYMASVFPQEIGLVGRLPLRPEPRGISAWVAVHGTPLLVHDAPRDPRYIPHPSTDGDDPVRTEYVIPIRSRNRMIGVLDCQCGRDGAFDAAERQLLETVATQISAALEAQALYRRVNELFQQYVAAPVARSMLEEQTSTELGGVRQEVTVLFADLDGFSTFAESVSPEVLLDTLQVYLGLATEAVLEFGGTPTQYLGDGLMAVFNAPQADELHSWHAIQAAQALRHTMKLHQEVTGGPPMRFAVGIHTGEAVVGNLGSASLRCYTAVGDTVNVAKRVQEHADGDEILLTEAVYNNIRRVIYVEEVGRVPVKGRAGAVNIYRLPDRPALGTKRPAAAYAVEIEPGKPPTGGGVEG